MTSTRRRAPFYLESDVHRGHFLTLRLADAREGAPIIGPFAYYTMTVTDDVELASRFYLDDSSALWVQRPATCFACPDRGYILAFDRGTRQYWLHTPLTDPATSQHHSALVMDQEDGVVSVRILNSGGGGRFPSRLMVTSRLEAVVADPDDWFLSDDARGFHFRMHAAAAPKRGVWDALLELWDRPWVKAFTVVYLLLIVAIRWWTAHEDDEAA